jgi:hypothetical protein
MPEVGSAPGRGPVSERGASARSPSPSGRARPPRATRKAFLIVLAGLGALAAGGADARGRDAGRLCAVIRVLARAGTVGHGHDCCGACLPRPLEGRGRSRAGHAGRSGARLLRGPLHRLGHTRRFQCHHLLRVRPAGGPVLRSLRGFPVRFEEPGPGRRVRSDRRTGSWTGSIGSTGIWLSLTGQTSRPTGGSSS